LSVEAGFKTEPGESDRTHGDFYTVTLLTQLQQGNFQQQEYLYLHGNIKDA
jgi:hypothetical protein